MPWVNLHDATVDNFMAEPLPIDAGGTGTTNLSAFAQSMVDYKNDMGLADFVVAQGTSGDWSYWKWDSGLAICYATITKNIEGVTTTGTSSSPCVYLASFDIVTPFSFVGHRGACSASVKNCTREWAKAGFFSNNNIRFAIYTMNGNFVNLEIDFDIVAIGKWK